MKVNYTYLLAIVILFLTKIGHSQSVVINEIMSSNSNAVHDEDGDYPDWLELYNPGNLNVNLTGFYLSDDPDSLMKWQFEDVGLGANGFLLVFTSDKNRQGDSERWTTLINWGDVWQYQLGISEPPANWNAPDFDDGAWLSGSTGIGYGDDDDITLIDPVISFYARKKFDIIDADSVADLMLHIDFDDAFVAYLNGQEIARANIGQPGTPPAYNELAMSDSYEARLYQDRSPRSYHVSQFASLIKSGENILAVQIHNHDPGSSDMTFIPFLSAKLKSGQSISHPNDFLNLPVNNFHTNFKIKSAGETLILSDTQGNIVDQVYSGLSATDVSRGRKPDGSENWQYFARSTPGTSNITPGSDSLISGFIPEFSHTGGFYDAPFNLIISDSTADVSIYYTRDGSAPTLASPVYSVPLQINSTQVIKARIIDSSGLAGETVTYTYFIDQERPLPVFSISTDPDNLWGPLGIYEDNFDLEVPVIIEMYETNGDLAFKHNAGAEIFGSGSSGFEQKSLAIFFRGKYGIGTLQYQLFPDLPFTEYESFVLRNGGNDWWSTLIRDAMTSNGLMNGTNVDYQAYRPAIVYLNGEYWGIHNIREKVNEHFIQDHYLIDEDSLDMLEYKERVTPVVIHGDRNNYNHLINFLEENDLSDIENYNYVTSLIDIDNYIDYHVIEIYCANIDWPANNNKFWRSKSESSRWRWILYDTDTGFGLWDDWWSYGIGGWEYDHMDHATTRTPLDNEEWPNPEWSTFIFRSLLKSETFRNEFINRFADYLNTRLSGQNVLVNIDLFYNRIAAALPLHLERWDRTEQDYNRELDKVKIFAQRRPNYARDHIIEHFKLPGTSNISLKIEPAGSGFIKLNSLLIENSSWQGIYFEEIPVHISAGPAAGYKFSGWHGVSDTTKSFIAHPEDLSVVTAIFEPSDAGGIVINEINYNSGDLKDPDDWFELFNNSLKNIDLSGWSFTDANIENIYTFPGSIILNSGSYLVIAKNLVKFSDAFGKMENATGGFGFGFRPENEQIRLYDNSGVLIDSVLYSNVEPWPVEPDGLGPTLELINPNKNNTIAENWAASTGFGTPGYRNSRYNIEHEPESQTQTPSEKKEFLNYPNPFHDYTNIRYNVKTAGNVNIKVFDILGREIITLLDQVQGEGNQQIVWYGKNSRGIPVSAGIYIYVYRWNNGIQSIRKMVKL